MGGACRREVQDFGLEICFKKDYLDDLDLDRCIILVKVKVKVKVKQTHYRPGQALRVLGV